MRLFSLLSFLLLPTLTHAETETVPCEITLGQLRVKMDATSANIANANNTRAENGMPFRRRFVECDKGHCNIYASHDIRIVYEPKHPDAHPSGLVGYPAIDLVEEMKTMLELQKEYRTVEAQCRDPQANLSSR